MPPRRKEKEIPNKKSERASSKADRYKQANEENKETKQNADNDGFEDS